MFYFVTGNRDKISHATQLFTQHNLSFETKNISIPEIQSDSIEKIAIHKAKEAFSLLKKPLIVNDAGWFIPGLNGFPGPYMKYINQWFTPKDFLNIMNGKQDRTVTLEEVICFIDETVCQTFIGKKTGVILTESHGTGLSSDCVISLDEDKETIAERKNENMGFSTDGEAWMKFIAWYKK